LNSFYHNQCSDFLRRPRDSLSLAQPLPQVFPRSWVESTQRTPPPLLVEFGSRGPESASRLILLEVQTRATLTPHVRTPAAHRLLAHATVDLRMETSLSCSNIPDNESWAAFISFHATPNLQLRSKVASTTWHRSLPRIPSPTKCLEDARRETPRLSLKASDSSARILAVGGVSLAQVRMPLIATEQRLMTSKQSICKDISLITVQANSPVIAVGRISNEEICWVRRLFLTYWRT
jgi:hypothetical protein